MTTTTKTTTHLPEFTPSTYPPLPANLPKVELETITLSKLESQDPTEQSRLFDICKEKGFFYLDLEGSKAEDLQRKSEDVARLAERIFRLPLEEKKMYLPRRDLGNTLFGYKHAGRTVTDSAGTPDTAEFFNVSKNDMVAESPSLPWPQVVLDQKVLLNDYMVTAHATGLFVLRTLAQKLGLPASAFDDLHRLEEKSGDHVRMTRGPPRKSKDMPEIQTPGHTDFGTITVLFNWLGGLQIWSESNRGDAGFANIVDPEDNEEAKWLWVIPKPGCAIVNLGDAAVKFTNGLFCSGRHRVVPAPGEQGMYPRYSVVYFVRPEDDAVLKCFKSPGISPPDRKEEETKAGEWIARQAQGLEQASKKS